MKNLHGLFATWNKLMILALLLIISMILLTLPSVNVDTLMNGTQSGKTIFFIYLMMGGGYIWVLRLILFSNTRLIRINTLDLILFVGYMNPSRFYPKYLLAKLYDETGQREKAVTTANELLDKEIKIESTAIEEIKVEMRKIIEK